MLSFKKNRVFLDKDTVAENLRLHRQKYDIKLSEVSKKINVPVKYLEALEKGNYDLLPPGVYGLNFLREYCSFFKLDYTVLSAKFLKERLGNNQEINSDVFDRRVVKKLDLVSWPGVIKASMIFLLALAMIVYFGFLIKKIFLPPNLDIINPKADFITYDRVLEIQGVTDLETELKINNELVPVDGFGHFDKKVDLKIGINNISINAKKKYSQANIVKRQILLKVDK